MRPPWLFLAWPQPGRRFPRTRPRATVVAMIRLWFAWLLAAGTCFVAGAAPLPGYLRWHRAEHRVDADVQGWPLDYTLRTLSTAAGWRVYVEPGLKGTVDARFENRPERQALATLLSDLSFAIVTSTNAPARLLVFQSSADRATAAVPPLGERPGTNALARELIVRVKKGGAAEMEALARKFHGKVAGAIPSLGVYRLVFEDDESAAAARAALGSESEVAGVESNYPLQRPTQIEPLSGEAAPSLNLKARPVSDGSSVTIALLDTGLPSGLEHADFLLPSMNVTGTSGATSDGLGHGPAMFETILQGLSVTDPGESGQAVRVLPIDIYGGQTETSTFALAEGIVAGLNQGADIINLSLSGPSPSPLVHDVLQQAAAAGVLVFAAPGNEPTTDATYPAAFPEVVAVTASSAPGQLADYANRGSFVDLIAPGTSVVPFGGDLWEVNGTSVSTAYAAGIAAGLLTTPGRTAADVLNEMRRKIGFQVPAASQPP